MSFPASRTKVKKLRKNKGGGVKAPKIQLTSLVDIMTILLVFLLKSFSTDGDIITPSKGLELPASTAKKKPEVALKVSISRDELMVEGQRITTLNKMMDREGLIVPELETILDQRRALTEKIAKHSTKVEFKGDVLIEADRQVRFKIIQKIMYTCGQSGFSNFSLLVLRKEG